MAPSRFWGSIGIGGGGIALTAGSASSHVATLARARGVPMIVRLGVDVDRPACEALIDGEGATLGLDPTVDAVSCSRAGGERVRAPRPREIRLRPAVTADGVPMRYCSISPIPTKWTRSIRQCCDGIGLVRTEFLFQASARRRTRRPSIAPTPVPNGPAAGR